MKQHFPNRYDEVVKAKLSPTGVVEGFYVDKTQTTPTGRGVVSLPSVVTLKADVTNDNVTGDTLEDVTGLSFPVVADQRYWFRFVIHYKAAATTTGSRWSIDGPAVTDLSYQSEYSLSTTSRTVNAGLSAYDEPAAANASSADTDSNMAIIEGFILPSASGTVTARFASEVSESAITALKGSFVQYMVVG